MEPPTPWMDKELAWWLQWEEVAVEEAWLGWDAATLEVVREATGPLMRGQLEGLGGPPRQLGRARCPWLRQSSCQWWWLLSHPTQYHYPSLPRCLLNTHGWPLASLGFCCSSLAARGCPSSHPMPCRAMLVGEPAKWP